MPPSARRAADFGRPHSSHWHVGDTPADVSAAEYGGARALGVCTGAHSAFAHAQRRLTSGTALFFCRDMSILGRKRQQ